ncbi:hypothetical protein M9H77_17532 [Catharanthus roseus]|uniref:Uncharacterized protein n=1 Tax=Catharanthus roseus TaxID=4058 RepID=A0ACC0B4V4_CATRO|nr:hypothetical protein M9H77_17532 [Catharanthus roseus]
MVKTKNANIGRGENVEEGGSSRGRGKGKRRHLELGLQRFISVREATTFEEWTTKRRKIAPGNIVDLNDMEVGVGDHIGPRKIYNQHTFKRMGFAKKEEGLFVRGGQNESGEDDEEDDDDDEKQEEINMDEEESDIEPEVETHRREIRQKKRQEKMEEGSSSVDMAQLMARIITMQSQLNSRLDDIDGKNKRSIFGVSRLQYIEAKDLGDQGYGSSLDEISFANYT